MAGKSNATTEHTFQGSVTTLTKIMVGVGLTLIIFCSIEYGKFESVWWVKFIKKIFETLGTTIFSVGMVSIVVEISTIKGIVDKAFIKLLNCSFPIECLSEENRKKMKKRIVAKETGISESEIENGIYRYEKDLLKLANTIYYDYHKITYYIIPDSKNQCFHINAKTNLKIINNFGHNEENWFRLSMKLFKKSPEMTNEEYLDKLDLKLRINGKVINPRPCTRIEPVEHKSESKYYDCKITIEKDLGSEQVSKIEAEYSYDVPIFDAVQAFKIARPCKNIEHRFYIKQDSSTGEKWSIRANAFSAFCHKQDIDDGNYKVVQDTDEVITVSYNNWSIVGTGYVVFYQKKE